MYFPASRCRLPLTAARPLSRLRSTIAAEGAAYHHQDPARYSLPSRKTMVCTSRCMRSWGCPGAVYDVIADEDIYTGDGTLRAAKDTVVETYHREDGTAQSGFSIWAATVWRNARRRRMVLNTQPNMPSLLMRVNCGSNADRHRTL